MKPESYFSRNSFRQEHKPWTTSPLEGSSMLSVFFRPEDSKKLYFKLNNSLHLGDPPFGPTYKIAGLYAIYRGDTCYYVGQSKNLPSRIATHLTGKYESADRVDLFFIGEDNFCGFYADRNKEEQKSILTNNENWLIQKLKPIENIYIQEFDGPSNKLCDQFQYVEDDSDPLEADAQIYLDETDITVINDFGESILSIPEPILGDWIREYTYIVGAL